MVKRQTAFICGFILGILLFIGLNIYSVALNYGGCIDCYGDFGFPFHFGDQRLFMALEIRNWSAFIADVGFAFACGIGLAFLVRFLLARLAPQD